MLHVLKPLATLFTTILEQGLQPSSFNMGFLIPTCILKKGKDALDPNNSRDIVISLIVTKTYEHVIDAREKPPTNYNLVSPREDRP